jgi:hypothetical protein
MLRTRKLRASAPGGELNEIVAIHYFYVGLRTLVSAAALKSSALPILRVAQLIVVTVFLFAAAHYCVALFSLKNAYHGIENPKPESGWYENDIFSHLIFLPSIDTVFDFLYFSTVTTATVGYGDMYPETRVAKILTIVLGAMRPEPAPPLLSGTRLRPYG